MVKHCSKAGCERQQRNTGALRKHQQFKKMPVQLLCVPHAKEIGHRCFADSLAECEADGCTATPIGGIHGHRCFADSLAQCEVASCHATPRGGIHGHRCFKDSLHQPAIELIDDTVESVEFLAQIGIDSIREDQYEVYGGWWHAWDIWAVGDRPR